MKKKWSYLEDIFCKYIWIICIIIAGGMLYLFHVGWITNIKLTMSDVITFSSVIFVVLSIILTLLISLKESELFERIKKHFPYIHDIIYKFINKVLFASVGVLIVAIVVIVIPSNIKYNFKLIIGFIGFYVFNYMLLGTMYLLKFTTDLVVKNHDSKKNKRHTIE